MQWSDFHLITNCMILDFDIINYELYDFRFWYHSIVKFKTYTYMKTVWFLVTQSCSNALSKSTWSLPLITVSWENDLASADQNKIWLAMIRNYYSLISNLNILYQHLSFGNKNTTFSSTTISYLMRAFKWAKITFENVSMDWPSKRYVTEMKYMLQQLSVSKILLTE